MYSVPDAQCECLASYAQPEYTAGVSDRAQIYRQAYRLIT